mmetsp:Transcript_44370/g.53630  ORF Transcript_44370/g.53630 Transcript_44370/m.53630 type:complete len:220 (+) Transcript_44370:77-736(+)|eukprot:CAMPEP_0172495932 /NCGR_PEP_ID=MMETSP1066-20121228/79738_1 /TAXON_ID=671091 /ORGANISM="Coscinodiscus wailesii, Strain CCMP2513" /LENGTH=219 /DNA_ID=CAMNT_0013267953 /DNA_START=66 /DNA_END=725 /DNA_ORIENTATION=+
MSEIQFDRYDAEFLTLSSQVQSSLTSIENKTTSGPPEQELKFAQSLLSQCDDLLKQMTVEARGVDDKDFKNNLLKKVRVCKAKLANLRDDVNAAKTSMERENLLGADGASGASSGKGHRERLLQTNEKLESQNETLENARRVMADTEGVALEITSELGRNREKIQSSHDRIRDVSGLTNQARRIVQSMNRRDVQQKLALYVVSFLIIGTMLIIIFRISG